MWWDFCARDFTYLLTTVNKLIQFVCLLYYDGLIISLTLWTLQYEKNCVAICVCEYLQEVFLVKVTVEQTGRLMLLPVLSTK